MEKSIVSKKEFADIRELWLKGRVEKTNCPNMSILNEYILKNIDNILDEYYEIDYSIIEEENPYENLLKELRGFVVK